MRPAKIMNLFTLMMVTCAFNVSLRNIPTIATTQWQMFFFVFLALVIFYIPVAMISAELATGWPKMGGIAIWVKEAYGKKMGFLAIWLQWIYMNIGVIAMLYFISASFAYVFFPQFAGNKIYLIIASLVLIWTFTYLNLQGLKISSKITVTFFILGVLIPGLIIITMGIVYLLKGRPLQISEFTSVKSFFPDLHFTSLVILIGFMRTFGGIEGSAVHANNVDNPKRNYPIAIAFTVLTAVTINILGALGLSFVIPLKDINLIGGVMSAFSIYFEKYNLKALVPLIAICVALGQTGGFSTWLAGPVKGLLESAQEGELPVFFQKVNKNNMPKNLMIVQAIIISISSCSFLYFSANVNISFWLSVALSMMIYLSMYFLMILSCLRLRKTQSNVQRTFKVPLLKLVATLGFFAMIFGFVMAFIPPQQVPAENYKSYFLTLSISIIIVFLIPLSIHKLKKSSWNEMHK